MKSVVRRIPEPMPQITQDRRRQEIPTHNQERNYCLFFRISILHYSHILEKCFRKNLSLFICLSLCLYRSLSYLPLSVFLYVCLCVRMHACACVCRCGCVCNNVNFHKSTMPLMNLNPSSNLHEIFIKPVHMSYYTLVMFKYLEKLCTRIRQ